MGIRIFDVDPGARSKKFSDDIVGRFRSGAQVNNRPLSLDEWRVTTGDPEVADAIVRLMGAKSGPQEWATEGEDNLEVYTTAESVGIVLEGPSSINARMALFGKKGLIHACDGETTTDGEPCPMAGKTVAERKEAAKAGYGCEPNISTYFRLLDEPDLGKFRFTSGSWKFAEDVDDIIAALEKVGGPARATLTLTLVEYDTKGGRHVRYRKPTIEVHGPYADPNA